MTHCRDLGLKKLRRKQGIITKDWMVYISKLILKQRDKAKNLPRVSSLTSVVLTRGIVD